MALIKIYFEIFKKSYFRESFPITNETHFYKALPNMKTNGLAIEVGLQLIKYLIFLHVMYITHSRGNRRRLSRRLLKQIQKFYRLL